MLMLMLSIATMALCCAHCWARRPMTVLCGVPAPPHTFLVASKCSFTKALKPVACRGCKHH